MKGSHRLALFGFILASAVTATAQSITDFENMKFRQIGPFRGGRSIACAGSVQRPNEYYFGATGGGIWKTTNGGEDWDCVSDGFLTSSSVGAIAIDPTNPDIVYAGTGERDIRGNISNGDGVYKTSDGGKTWQHIGLRECDTISTIVVDPKNPNNVYVAAFGHVYVKRDLDTGKVTADPNRGVYKSTDGGKTWNRILYRNEVTGAVDLSIDPNNPQVIYAALWEAWRTPYLMNSGGPGSGMFKSVDGGTTWKEITRNSGLPQGTVGKIGISVSPVDSKRVYAIIEALDGGIFRSDDAGETWTMTNNSRAYRQRAWYYTHIIADPKLIDRVYVLNVSMGRSNDGGKTFSGLRIMHSDSHDLWIAPDDSNRMIESDDGGAAVTKDAGQNWTAQDYPTSQFYHVSTDNAFPYRILGAQQDNSTIRIASRTRTAGITAEAWTSTAGGESGYVSAKPDDPDVVFGGSYGGYLERLNYKTGTSRDVNPWPDNPMGHGAENLVNRMQWTFPIVFSPHNPNLLYTCSQYVMRSTNAGQKWDRISPDLTKNDKRTMKASGGPITKDNTSVEYYGTVFTVAESPVKKGVIWAGSDDGVVHVTLDNGRTWKNVTPKGMPEWALCSMIDPSPFDAGTAYLAADNHENDDYAPYVYITRDYGQTWHRMTTGIDRNAFVRVVREDTQRRGLLYCGTETGLFVSFNGGGSWERFRSNLPLTPIHDLAIKDGDLVVGTHGRSFWVLDDLSPLRGATTARTATFFPPRDTYRVTWGGAGNARTVGQNPPSGILINYWLPTKGEGNTNIEIMDAKGTVIGTSTGPVEAGLNRTSLAFPRYPGYRTLPGLILWGAGGGSIQAPPGEYSVKVSHGSWSQTQKLKIIRTPLVEATDAELRAQFDLAIKIRDRVTSLHESLAKIRDAKRKVAAEKEKNASLASAADAFTSKLSAVEEDIYQVKNQSGQDPLNYPIKLNNRMAALLPVVTGGEFGPTQSAIDVFAGLSKEADAIDARVKVLWEKDLAAFNEELKKLGIAPIVPEPAGLTTPGGGPRRGGEDQEGS